MRDFFKTNKGFTTAGFVSLVLVLAVLVFWKLELWPFHHVSTALPPLPDLAGQPKILVDFLQNLNDEALKAPSSDRAVGNLAMAYQANFFYDQAKVCYQKASELNDREWRWAYYSALVDEELGNTRATIDKLTRALDANPDNPQAWFRLGNSYLKTNAFQDAERAFQRVLSMKDPSPEDRSRMDTFGTGAFPLKAYASYNLARVEFQQNEWRKVETTLSQLIEQQPRFGPAYRLLGSVYTKLGDQVRSIDNETRAGDFESYLPPTDPVYDEMVLSSRNVAFLIKQFDIAAKSENYNWTQRLMNHMLAISPNDAEVLTKRIKLALDMQMLSTVDSLLPSFYRLCGSDDKKLIDMARYFVYRGQYEPAVVLLKRATRVNPKAIDAHVLFVDILSDFKQYDMAISYCNELISIDSRNVEIRNRLARMYIEQGRIEEARQQVKTAQKLSPDEELRLIMLGRIGRKQQSTESALDHFRKALQLNPRNVNLQLEVGNYLVELNRWSEALAHFQTSLTTSPNDLDLLERYAWLLGICPVQNLGDGEKALSLANRLSLRRKFTKPQEMRCGMTLAAAYGRSGRFDQALEIANKCLGWAKTMRETSYLRRLEAMISSFQQKKPYVL